MKRTRAAEVPGRCRLRAHRPLVRLATQAYRRLPQPSISRSGHVTGAHTRIGDPGRGLRLVIGQRGSQRGGRRAEVFAASTPRSPRAGIPEARRCASSGPFLSMGEGGEVDEVGSSALLDGLTFDLTCYETGGLLAGCLAGGFVGCGLRRWSLLWRSASAWPEARCRRQQRRIWCPMGRSRGPAAGR
jgi:hypothetical protein